MRRCMARCLRLPRSEAAVMVILVVFLLPPRHGYIRCSRRSRDRPEGNHQGNVRKIVGLDRVGRISSGCSLRKLRSKISLSILFVKAAKFRPLEWSSNLLNKSVNYNSGYTDYSTTTRWIFNGQLGLRSGNEDGRIRFVFAALRGASSNGGARKDPGGGAKGRRTSRMCLG